MRFCHVGVVKAAFACVNHPTDRSKRLFSHSVGCRRELRSLGAFADCVTIIALKKKTAVIGTIWILSAVLNFGLNLVLIPYLGLIGAALTTFLAFLLAFVLTIYYSLRQFKFDVNYGFIVKSVCGSSIMALFLLFWNPSGLLSIVLSIALAAVIYLTILLVLRGLTIQEIKLIYRIYRGS